MKEQKLEFICKEQENKLKDFVKLEVEFSQLKSKYKATNHDTPWQSSPLYFILWKMESGQSLTSEEVHWLSSNSLFRTNAIAQDIERFAQLKSKYKATQYQGSYSDSILYKILKKLDLSERLTEVEYNFLLNNQLLDTAKIFEQQESERKDKFAYLIDKYQAKSIDNLSLVSPLYSLLQKIDENNNLSESEVRWLEQQGLHETIAMAQELEKAREFAALKVKYQATGYDDCSPKSHLYKVLKRLELDSKLSEQDLNFLRNRKLTETIAIANQQYACVLKSKIKSGEILNEVEIEWLKNNRYEDIINIFQKHHFTILKKKYGLIDLVNKLTLHPFYHILLKLERNERLDPILFFQLVEQDLLSRDGKVALKYYTIEAEFYVQEFQHTGNKWHIPTASSYWRKANEPEQALQLTDLDLNHVKDNTLKSAILVTRGAAFRDIGKLDAAESCARKAMKYHALSYQPYTLMGAIAYDKGDYPNGDSWFKEAIQRGAKTEDIDDEIKRVVKNTKDEEKRHTAAAYLLKKNSERYAWAKAYLKKSKDKDKG
ncbi:MULTISPECIES: tetratricopeptide repeat protein [Nostocales]|uniref:Tetratricopeptide repeat protein n=2 Tax=Nostocales TaxID=1161 RepID=A0ABW8WW22_9CYAN